MSAVLMDTHALVWLTSGQTMTPTSRIAIADAQVSNRLYVSAISAWEAAVALRKPVHQPNLGGRQADAWFDDVLKLPGARILFVSKRIALEAAKVPAILGSGDPGDCFLIATARVKKIPIVTRDATMHALAAANPGYIRTIRC